MYSIMKKAVSALLWLCFSFFFLFITAPFEVRAATLTWHCTDDNWAAAECWSPIGPPVSADTVNVSTVGGVNTQLRIDNLTGTASAGSLYIDASAGTTVTLLQTGGSLSASNEYIGYNGTGTFTQSGGTNTITNSLAIALSAGSTGTYNLSGGTLTAGSIVNNGTFNQSGATTVTASVTNTGSYNISGAGGNTIAGNFTNTGTVKTTGTTAVFTGIFTNTGAYISDPSSNYFTDLTVGTTGYLVGGVGDNFFISNDFINNSTQNALWNTVNAYLGFTTGVDAFHDFYYLTAADYGASPTGFSNNLAWDTLFLDAGNILNFYGSAFYVDNLVLGSGSYLNLNGIRLYYNTLTDYGATIEFLNNGSLIQIASAQVPEPSTLLLLGSGLAGLTVLRKRLKVRGS